MNGYYKWLLWIAYIVGDIKNQNNEEITMMKQFFSEIMNEGMVKKIWKIALGGKA